jgi:hypothetical protein
MSILPIPADEHIRKLFEEYALALGKVAHAWNYLQEKLGELFCVVTGRQDEQIASAIWYSITSDRGQRGMLRAAIEAPGERFKHPKAKDDILWLIKKANHYSELRNDAVHAPCSITIGTRKFEIIASYFNGHPRAENLKGKDILREFALYEALAETFSTFTQQVKSAILSPEKPWPDKPHLPTLGQESPLPPHHSPPSTPK